MRTSPPSAVGTLEQLSIGVARTSIRRYHSRPKKRWLTGFSVKHGEQIFVWNHIENGMIIYSHSPELKADDRKALAQIPFTVKKQKPAVLRRDYWRPLCLIRFAAGQAVVGRNVFQKLREFRHLHELQWGWQAEELLQLSKPARGAMIHNQKPNAVADIAAVLAGAGRGNLMWTTAKATEKSLKGEEEEAAKEQPEQKNMDREKQKSRRKSEQKKAAVEGSDTPQAARKAGEEPTDTPVEPTKVETSQATLVSPSLAPPPPTPDAKGTTAATKAKAALKAGAKKKKKKKKKAAKLPKVERRKRRLALKDAAAAAAAEDPAAAAAPRTLLPATIYWSNDADLAWAREWSDNVVHEVGLPDNVKVAKWKTQIFREDHDQEKEQKQTTAAETEVGAQEVPKTEKSGVKSWLGSMLEKLRSSARKEVRL